jgi:hypothetical protein
LSIKDRNARVENRKKIVDENSVTIEETRGQSATKGVIPESIGRGIPGPNPVGATSGVAFPMPGMGDGVRAAPTCSGTTKKGAACKAHPIVGGPFCVGHARANGPLND